VSRAEPTTNRNRRARPRRAAKGSIRAACRLGRTGLGKNLALRLLDVSEAGACLALAQAVGPGREVEVGLLAPCCGREHRRAGQVVWCAAAADGSHLAGVRFDQPLSYAILHDLGRLPGA
jgi:hypothetical protein